MPKAKLKWGLHEYTPANLREKPMKEVRAEYSRLRSIARKRLNRLANSEFSGSQAYRMNRNLYVPLKDIKDSRTLYSKLTMLSRFIVSEQSTVTGQSRIRDKTISTLHERGYTMVNKFNFLDFVDFMEDFRARKLNKLYDSSQALELFDLAESKGYDSLELTKDFDAFMKNKAAFKKLEPNTRNRIVSSDEMLSMINDIKKKQKVRRKGKS